MSDAPVSPESPSEGVPAPSAVSPSASAPPAGTSDDLGELPTDQAVFNRGYVENIRSQAARYRTEAATANDALRTYQDVYGGYDDGDREVWFTLAREWASSPDRAAAMMRAIADDVLGPTGRSDAPAGGAETAPAMPETPEQLAALTPEQVQQLIDQSLSARDAKANEDRQVNEVFAEIRAAGYEPESDEGWWILRNAAQRTNGDVAKAVEMFNTFKQGIIDQYVQGRSGARPSPAPSGGVQATGAPQEIKSIEDARRATNRFIQERRLAQ